MATHQRIKRTTEGKQQGFFFLFLWTKKQRKTQRRRSESSVSLGEELRSKKRMSLEELEAVELKVLAKDVRAGEVVVGHDEVGALVLRVKSAAKDSFGITLVVDAGLEVDEAARVRDPGAVAESVLSVEDLKVVLVVVADADDGGDAVRALEAKVEALSVDLDVLDGDDVINGGPVGGVDLLTVDDDDSSLRDGVTSGEDEDGVVAEHHTHLLDVVSKDEVVEVDSSKAAVNLNVDIRDDVEDGLALSGDVEGLSVEADDVRVTHDGGAGTHDTPDLNVVNKSDSSGAVGESLGSTRDRSEFNNERYPSLVGADSQTSGGSTEGEENGGSVNISSADESGSTVGGASVEGGALRDIRVRRGHEIVVEKVRDAATTVGRELVKVLGDGSSKVVEPEGGRCGPSKRAILLEGRVHDNVQARNASKKQGDCEEHRGKASHGRCLWSGEEK